MSIKVMAHIWESASVSGSELLVLLAMADFADDTGRNIYPSMTTLAHKARLSESQARRVVHDLCSAGIVEVVESGGWDGKRNRSNEYRIVLDNENLMAVGPALSLPKGGGSMMTPPRADATTGGSNLTPPSSRPRAHRGSTGAPTVVAPAREDPLLDPLLDPSEEENNNNTVVVAPPQEKNCLRELVMAEAETAVVVVGIAALLAQLDDEQALALLSWLWLYNGWYQDDLSARDIFRRAYRHDPFARMGSVGAVIVANARARAPAPLIADDRAEMAARLREMQEAAP